MAAIPAGFAEPPSEASDADPLGKRETMELVGAYYRIDDPLVRRRLFDLAKALAGETERPYTRRKSRSPRAWYSLEEPKSKPARQAR